MYKYLFRIILILLISGFCFNASATDCNAVETDVAVTQYEVTYKKVMMITETCYIKSFVDLSRP